MLSRRNLVKTSLCAAAVSGLVGRAYANPAGKIVYVANAGRDSADGSTPDSAVATLERATALSALGDTIALRRGDTWHELLHLSKPQLSVRPFGEGPEPTIFGDSRRNCIWISGPNVSLENIVGIDGQCGAIVQGKGAAATIRNCQFMKCGTGIAVGGGGKPGWGGPGLGPHQFGQLILADNVVCRSARTALGAGDGIQIGEDSTAGVTHIIRNSSCEYNEWAGINAKSGKVFVENSNLSLNGLMGWNAHNNCEEFHIQGCVIEKNSAAERGTGQAMIEDHVKVYSSRNVYRNPHNAPLAKGNYTLQIHVVPGAHADYEKNPELNCIADVFVNRVGQSRTLGSIGVFMTERFPARLKILHCTFDHARNAGTAIDCYRSSKIRLEAKNNIFSVSNGRALRLDADAEFRTLIDHNLYFGTGPVVEIEGRRSYSETALAQLFADWQIERHGIVGDPRFMNAESGDYRLSKLSPGRNGGARDTGVERDAAGKIYGSPPAVGAYAAS